MTLDKKAGYVADPASNFENITKAIWANGFKHPLVEFIRFSNYLQSLITFFVFQIIYFLEKILYLRMQ